MGYLMKYGSVQRLIGAAKSLLKYYLALSIYGFSFQMFTKADSPVFAISHRFTKSICRFYSAAIKTVITLHFQSVLFPPITFVIIWKAK